MPIVFDPEGMPRAVVTELARELRAAVVETLEIAKNPPAEVHDPASLEAAVELLRATLVILDRPGPREIKTLGAEVNLAYASTVAAMDLVKSHTAMPRVPRPRSPPAADAA